MSAPGRSCPLRYRYGAAALARAPERAARTLYVIGGLYGNPQALDTLLALAAAEPEPVTLCFNGDFNWFDIDDAGFSQVNARVLQHDATLGNVEAELAHDGDDAGCGCAYPQNVGDEIVERSNRIHAQLKRTAARHPELLAQLSALPMVARYRVGGVRIGVVHGDAEALAGWRFGADALDEPALDAWRETAFMDARVDVFASSHTCLPALRAFDYAGPRLVINNGAAGMPNFRGEPYGLITRVATQASPHAPLYGLRLGPVRVEALPLRYDHEAWQRAFLANWPPGSPAWLSYFERITRGPAHALREACALAAA